jgi:kynureninase
MLETHIKFHGLNPHDVIVEVQPREGESVIRIEDIEETIKKHSGELALVFWGAVNYYTGQVFDIKRITEMAHNAGAMAGFDLAHAIGNIQLSLHEWNVDFACWCSYKYLNSGPGGVGGAYIHERYHENDSLPRLAGWWGYDRATRFDMRKGFRSMPTAEGWQLSTPPIVLMAMHKAALDIFDEAEMTCLVAKGKQLSDYLVHLLDLINQQAGEELIKILTPSQKGCQVSMMISSGTKYIFEQLTANGIFVDWREPGVIRAAPVPLYNKFSEVHSFYQALRKLLLS